MRLPLLLPALLVAVVVACNGDGVPDTSERPVESTPAPSAAPSAVPTQAPTSALPTPQPTPQTLPPAPSGSLLFFASGNAQSDIYRINVDGSGLTNLTPHMASSWPGRWSPDGASLAFTSREEGNSDIYIMDPAGGGVTNITNTEEVDESFVSWSPDGRRLLFAVAVDVAVWYWLMDADGTDRRQLVSRCGDCTLRDWSPDGRELVGYLTVDDQPGIYVITAADGMRRRIPGAAESIRPMGVRTQTRAVTWSPDGSWITYVQTYGPRDTGLFVVRPDGSDARRLYVSESIGSAVWSPDSRRLAFSTHAGEVKTVAIDGQELKTVATGDGVYYLDWSPDGHHIAYVSRHEGNAEVYVVPARGGEPRNVSNSPWSDTSPRWSPDGRQLLFRSDRNTRDGIYWMRPDGSQQTRITAGPVEPRAGGALPYTYPGLLKGCQEAPGQFLGTGCLLPDDVAAVLATLEQEGIRPYGSQPVLSPDGGWLAFWGQAEELPSLYVVDLSTGIAERLTGATTRGNTALDLQWSPDGQHIYYMDGGYCIQGCVPGFLYRIRPDGTGEEQLTTLRVGVLLGFVP